MSAPPVKDRFCSFCGAEFAPPLAYPRTCASPSCGITVWANPIPVGVLLVPVRDGDRRGLLLLRRGIPPREGYLALPGGFLEEHETWQEGAARELREELGVIVSPASLRPAGFVSTAPRPNRVLLFCESAEVARDTLPPFTANHETVERGIAWGPAGLDALMAFPLHLEAAQRWFEAQGITGPHAYATA